MKKLILLVSVLTSFFVSNAQTNDDLVKACMAGDLATVKSLVEKGADVNATSSTGAYPIESGLLSVDITKYLIDKGAKLSLPEFPVISRAAYFGNVDIVKLLLDAGDDPNRPYVSDPSAALKKILADEQAKGKKANKILVKAYQSAIDKMSASSGVKTYALQRAINGSNSLECIKLLVDHGAKTDILNSITQGNLIDEVACTGKSKAARIAGNQFNAPYFEKAGNVVPDWYKNPDTTKMATPDEIIKYLVSKGVDINGKDAQGKTPLINALMVPATYIQHDVVLGLVNNGSDLNVEYITVGKPFIVVAGYGWTDVLKAMVAKGADINQDCKMEDASVGSKLSGMNALMYAAQHNNLDAVQYLLSLKPSFSGEANGIIFFNHCLTNVKGKTAIYFAIESGNMDLVSALVDAHYWGGVEFSILERPQQTSVTNGITTTTTTWCYEGGRYIPSKYAKELGLDEMKEYLKKKML
jgi:ankyrin repeat protein